jgi:hypothetical protein
VSARPLPMPISPALLKHADQRRQQLENRIADQSRASPARCSSSTSTSSGSPPWIGLRVGHYTYVLLTMIVLLEAIFLSTFVLISQNRADEKRQVLADHPVADDRARGAAGTNSCSTCPTRS